MVNVTSQIRVKLPEANLSKTPVLGGADPVNPAIKQNIVNLGKDSSGTDIRERKWDRFVRSIHHLVMRIVNFFKKIFCFMRSNKQEHRKKLKLPGTSGTTQMKALKNENAPLYPGITGIRNPGNNCYINSTNQCLLHSQAFLKIIQDPLVRLPNEKESAFNEREVIAGRYSKLRTHYLEKNSRKILSSSNKLRKLMYGTELGKACGFAGPVNAQNDAERVARFLLTTYGANFVEEIRDVITHPELGGPIPCGPKRNDLFTLPVVIRGDDHTMQSLINATFTDEEHVDDAANPRQVIFDDGTEVNATTWTRKTKLETLPDLLPVHLLRFAFAQDEGKIKKNNDTIDIKFGTIDLALAINSPQPVLYNLAAVVVHSGSVNGGHFVSYVKSDDKWFYTSDSTIKPLENEAEFWEKAKDGYLFFYEKVK